jgi:hypothetical protein
MQTVSTIGLDIAKSVFSNGTMSGISKRVAQGFYRRSSARSALAFLSSRVSEPSVNQS